MKRKKRKKYQSYAELKRKEKVNMICGAVFFAILFGIVIALSIIVINN